MIAVGHTTAGERHGRLIRHVGEIVGGLTGSDTIGWLTGSDTIAALGTGFVCRDLPTHRQNIFGLCQFGRRNNVQMMAWVVWPHISGHGV